MIYIYDDHIRAHLRASEDFGFSTYDLVGYPRRLCETTSHPTLVETNIDKRRVKTVDLPTHTAAHRSLPEGENWLKVSSRTLKKLYASFLIAEDPQRRLDARKAATLMHQVSLVQHILQHSTLRKVLIGDEVGLGKTIEAGLLIKQLLNQKPGIRVLYLAPARLVTNVAQEFRSKLDIDARVWVAGSGSDARLEDDKIVIASINKAVFGDNLKKVASSGPWDILIVDECHHLSDWDPKGGKPNQAFQLVSALVKQQTPEHRLILMSGTPHQGNEARFQNILRLLSDDGKTVASAAGRVIFRTKERVRDWKGAPLFPSRDIRQPVVVSLGSEYEAWYSRVGRLYEDNGFSGNRLRASGWAKGQALQWAASSVQAGVGFLVRLAIRRLGWNLENPALKCGIEALRPYRGGPKNESLQNLYQRLIKQIGKTVDSKVSELDDEEECEEEKWTPDPELLADLLLEGVSLIRSNASQAKWDAVCTLIDNADGEKVVLFAQPVETVTTIADILESRYGERPALIIGNQNADIRMAEVARFQSDSGPRFLVSSKAGGEGLNMQRARRLIHLDVPWNPMDLEQRIGRIHRFGSRKTVIVDTVVANGSREVDMYRIARDKLALIARHLEPEEFETLFSRVMSLVPPKELEDILGDVTGTSLLDTAAAQEIGRLVSEGYKIWSTFDETYRKQADDIRATNPGEAEWTDLGNFLIRHVYAKEEAEATFSSFEFLADEIVATEEKVPTISIEGKVFVCGDTGGLPAVAEDGKTPEQLGLNIPLVQLQLREAFSTTDTVGPAFINLPPNARHLVSEQQEDHTFLAFLRQGLRSENGAWSETSLSLHIYTINQNGDSHELDGRQRANFVRAVCSAKRVKNPTHLTLHPDIQSLETNLLESLRRPTDGEIQNGVRYAVWPLGVITAVK